MNGSQAMVYVETDNFIVRQVNQDPGSAYGRAR